MEKERNYTYKGNTYVILGVCKMKDSKKNWIDAVRYQDINNKDKGEFIRSKKQFFDKFIPTELAVGDEVLIVSMGKKVGVVKVVEINGDIATLDKVDKKITTKISKGGGITNIGAFEYFFYNREVEKKKIMY